jgi:hypothetical protein
MMTTEPAADVAGMTDDELLELWAHKSEIDQTSKMAQAFSPKQYDLLQHVRIEQAGSELRRRLAQPAPDLDALRKELIVEISERVTDGISAVVEEWEKNSGNG